MRRIVFDGACAVALLLGAIARPAAGNPADGLVGWWQFDEGSGTTARDSSGFGNDGALAGDVSWTTDAISGAALSFGPTSSGSVTVPFNPVLNPQVGTIEAWVSLAALRPGTDADLIDELTTAGGVGGRGVIGLRVRGDGGAVAFILNKPSDPVSPWTTAETPASLITVGEYHHLAMRWDGRTLDLFIDGARQASMPYTPVPGTGLAYEGSFPLFFGQEFAGPVPTSFIGRLDDVRFYGIARTDAQISTDFATGGSRPAQPPGRCQAPLTRCGGTCVDTRTDAANCGACGAPCSSTASGCCADGACLPGCSDSDHDGIADDRDLCPRSHGATLGSAPRSLPDPADLPGCTSLQVIQLADSFARPARAALGRAAQYVQGDSAFAAAAAGLETARVALESAVQRVASGDVCGGAPHFDEFERALAGARGAFEAVAGDAYTAAGAADLRTLGSNPEHFGQAFGVEVMIEIGRVHFDEAASAGAAARRKLSVPCAQAVATVPVSGRVAGVDAAAREISLVDGTLIGFGTDGPGLVAPGLAVRALTIQFSDGSVLATQLVPGGYSGTSQYKVSSACLEFRVAPVQGFPPFYGPPFVLHRPEAYLYVYPPVLHLEGGMRFAAEIPPGRPWCKPAPSPYIFEVEVRSLQLDLKHWAYEGGEIEKTTTFVLVNGSEPVALPFNMFLNKPASLTVTELSQKCTIGFSNCTPLKVVSGPKTWALEMRERFGRASVKYSNTVFGVEDGKAAWQPTSAETAAIDGFNKAGVPFRAQGCPILAGKSTCDSNVLGEIAGTQPFAIYAADFDDQNTTNRLEKVGVLEDHLGGVIWPRVTGTNNGYPFWYSTDLPSLVRDQLDDVCPAYDFYKLPFAPGTPGLLVANGNCNPTGDPGHCGKDASSNPQIGIGNQDFAWDVWCSSANGDAIRAARGGKVVRAHEGSMSWRAQTSCTMTTKLCAEPVSCCKSPETCCFFNSDLCCGPDPAVQCCDNICGNHVYIQHQDGTFGIYCHLSAVSFPIVLKKLTGVKVSRGETLGICGETGNTICGNPPCDHLHFQIHACNQANLNASQCLSVPSRYAGFKLLPDQSIPETCWAPFKGDVLGSDNGP